MSRVVRARTRVRIDRRVNRWARVGLLAVGVWLTVAPFALEYGNEASVAPTINDMLTGVLVVTLALFSLLIPARVRPQ
ncbi:SPW repeat domain-containing protein [Actinophytocola sp.]|uniref:SPW repeat domain-containing protein n=1 Tax=Actinophytocola sp. TaxID=1872138 RepID=UPI003D6B24C7